MIENKCKFQDTAQGPSCDSCGAAPKYCFDFIGDDPQSVDCLIQFMYRQNYQNNYGGLGDEQKDGRAIGNPDEIKVSDCVDDCHPVFHVRVYALAEKYGIPALKKLALDKFQKSMQQGISPDQFMDSAEEAYTSTVQQDRGLRDAIIDHFHAHPELLDDEFVKETIQRMDSLTYDLLMRWHREHTKQLVFSW